MTLQPLAKSTDRIFIKNNFIGFTTRLGNDRMVLNLDRKVTQHGLNKTYVMSSRNALKFIELIGKNNLV